MSVAAAKFPTCFEMRLDKATFFQDLLEAISDQFSKAYFFFSDKGLDVQAVDTSGIALVALLLPFEAFDYYRCDRAVSGGLSLVDMAKACRRANNDDILTIKALGNRFNMVTFTFETPNGVIRDYDFNCVDIDDGPFEIKETLESEYQATVRIPSAMFMGICNNLSSLVERGTAPVGVIISVDKEHVEFFTHGGTGILKGSVSRQALAVGKPKEPILIRSKEEVSLTFELRLMNSFSKASTLSDQVTIHLSSKQPAVFEYKMQRMAIEDPRDGSQPAVLEYKILGMGYIRYYMMPAGISKEDEVQKMQRMAIED